MLRIYFCLWILIKTNYSWLRHVHYRLHQTYLNNFAHCWILREGWARESERERMSERATLPSSGGRAINQHKGIDASSRQTDNSLAVCQQRLDAAIRQRPPSETIDSPDWSGGLLWLWHWLCALKIEWLILLSATGQLIQQSMLLILKAPLVCSCLFVCMCARRRRG